MLGRSSKTIGKVLREAEQHSTVCTSQIVSQSSNPLLSLSSSPQHFSHVSLFKTKLLMARDEFLSNPSSTPPGQQLGSSAVHAAAGGSSCSGLPSNRAGSRLDICDTGTPTSVSG